MTKLKSKLRKLIHKKGILHAWLYLGVVSILAFLNADSIILVFAGTSVAYLFAARNADDLARSVLGLSIYLLTAWVHLVDWYFYVNFNFLFARRAFFKRTLQRAHWVGAEIARPHRLAFITLVIVMVAGVVTAPGIQAALYWSIAWGSLFSFFVTYQSLALIYQRATVSSH
jgi:hypothetical protein